MRHFSLVVLLVMLSIACFGQEVKPTAKPEDKPKTTTEKSGKTQVKPEAKPKSKPANAQTVTPQTKTKAKPELKTAIKKSAATPKVNPKTKPKPQLKTAQAKVKKAASKTKSETPPKPGQTDSIAGKPKDKPKDAPKDKPKAQSASAVKSGSTKTEPKAKPQPKPAVAQPEPTAMRTPHLVNPTVKPSPVKPKDKPVSKPSPKPTIEAVESTTIKPKDKPKPRPAFEECNLTLKDAPVIRNLRLGMTRDDADKIIPNDRRINYVNSPTITSYPFLTSAAGFENVDKITARFSDDKLNALEIAYSTDGVKWENAQEFARNLSGNLKLPLNSWRFSGRKQDVGEIRCREFSLEIDSTLNEITLQSLTLPESPEQENETNKKVFKP